MINGTLLHSFTTSRETCVDLDYYLVCDSTWAMKTHCGTSGAQPYSETLDKLSKTFISIATAEARLWLISQLIKERLTTRDIYYFALKQAQIRTENKEPDIATVRFAMKAKQRDIESNLMQLRSTKKKTEEDLLSKLGGRKYKFRKLLKRAKDTATLHKDKKILAFKQKVDHYRNNQVTIGPPPNTSRTTGGFENKATSLNEYNSLCIFRGPDSLPRPAPPLGPFICDPTIELNQNERTILSKTPKFSIRTETKRQDMKIEIERSLAKHRYNKSSFKKKSINKKSPELIHKESGDRLKTLQKLWEAESDRMTYNQIAGSLDFTQRRPTDYRHNKNVKLPKPLDTDSEFSCEFRRRKILEAFDNFQKTMKDQTRVANITTEKKRGKTRHKDTNLSRKEEAGLKSLKERIKSGELIVAQTDKSSRFCVMKPDQYLESGKTHTDKDDEIDWPQIKTLQNRVNSVVWWLSKFLNHSIQTDDKRMMRNIQDHNSEVADMYLLFKDHKSWTPNSDAPIPSRPVVSGNKTYNVHLSELLSEVLEPVAKESTGAEVSSTEDALCKISELNKWVEEGNKLDHIDALNLQNNKFSFRESNKKLDDTSPNQSNLDFVDIFSDEDEQAAADTLAQLARERIAQDELIAQENNKDKKGPQSLFMGWENKDSEHNGSDMGPQSRFEGWEHKDVASEAEVVPEHSETRTQPLIYEFFGKNKNKQENLEELNINALEKAETRYNKMAQKEHKFTDMLETQFKASECWNKLQTLEMNRLKREEPLTADLKFNSTLQEEDEPPIMLGGGML